jgi:phosphoribosylformimino-5-aminoimidazole carboxamide ribotide isomerase
VEILGRMTIFRPCIDLHAGHVKQIVGGTLNDSNEDSLKTNFVSEKSAGYYANLYRQKHLTGAHVILLGPGNDEAAKDALKAWPGGLQVGGGINAQNARQWIDLGADKVGLISYSHWMVLELIIG